LLLTVLVLIGVAHAYDGHELADEFLLAYTRSDFTKYMDYFVPPDEVFEELDDRDVELVVGRIVGVGDVVYRCVTPFYIFTFFRPLECDSEERSLLRKESGFERTYVILDETQLENLGDRVYCYDVCYQAGADISIDFEVCEFDGKEWLNGYSFYSSRKIVASFLDHALCYLAQGKARAWMLYSLAKMYLAKKIEVLLGSDGFEKVVSIFER